MNKIANVIFAYSPKNDDELELTVDDKIEVIGFEEEGKFNLIYGTMLFESALDRYTISCLHLYVSATCVNNPTNDH